MLNTYNTLPLVIRRGEKAEPRCNGYWNELICAINGHLFSPILRPTMTNAIRLSTDTLVANWTSYGYHLVLWTPLKYFAQFLWTGHQRSMPNNSHNTIALKHIVNPMFLMVTTIMQLLNKEGCRHDQFLISFSMRTPAPLSLPSSIQSLVCLNYVN